uniref:Major facilitator superfamily domain-containing protein 12 isoform X2 n=1 Tax=Rhizophora mucronata TaxID=61149 RepID=A0A2P2LCQ2_RHIMU
MLKTAAEMLYEMVFTANEQVPNSLQGQQPPKTEENETATNKDPAPCHTLKRPNLSSSSPANMVANPSAIWPESITIAASLGDSPISVKNNNR